MNVRYVTHPATATPSGRDDRPVAAGALAGSFGRHPGELAAAFPRAVVGVPGPAGAAVPAFP